jgi:hypothetical protein
MHNISARNKQDYVICEQRPYRRDTPKPRKTYMKKRVKLDGLTRFFGLLSLTA